MNALDIEGVFWLARNPDNQVAGRLTFDAQNGVELNLIGTFHDVHEAMARRTGERVSVTDGDIFDAKERSVRIYGSTTQGPVTIEDCSVVGSTFTIGGPQQIPNERYDGRTVFLGAEIDEQNEPPAITGIKVRIRNLEHWLSKSGVRFVFAAADDSAGAQLDRVDIDLPDSMVSSSGTDEMTFSFRGVVRGDHFVESVFEQRCHFSLCRDVATPYDNLLKACAALQDLITIGLDEPSVITSVSVRLAPPKSRTVSSEVAPEWVRLYAKLLGSDIKPRKKSLNAINTIFSFDDIGGIEGVRQWMELAHRFDAVVGSLMRHWYIPSMYIQDRFFNSVVAAEALARIRAGQQNINLRMELEGLAGYAGDVFLSIVDDSDLWAKRVVRVRDNNIVHIGLRRDIGSFSLQLLSESLYYLVVLCLLRECGVPDEALKKLGTRERVRRLCDRMKSVDWQALHDA